MKRIEHLMNGYSGLYTDFYELSMAQAYFYQGRKDHTAGFDYFFRKNPFDGGYVIFSGINELLPILENLSFNNEAIDYLKKEGFGDEFLDYLRNFQFKGTLKAPKEGEVVFPREPVLTFRGNIIELQVIETIVLNFLNFSSLIATKASRIRAAAGDRAFADFGLRRAQGLGGLQASRAAIVGGANSSSNMISGMYYDIPVGGTMAHSWIQTYEDELEAFRRFAEIYPDNCVLLVDTYYTLQSGIPNAIKVGKELEAKGKQLKGIRLDSGDLAYFSKKARKMLDEAGLDDVKIMVSNQLDENVIRSLNLQNAPIDGFGVGTKLIVGLNSAALDGVYKLSMYNNEPRLKLSENIEKTTFPGNKKTVRYLHDDGTFYADGILLEDEEKTNEIVHPYFADRRSDVSCYQQEEILNTVMEHGKNTTGDVPVTESAAYAKKRLKQLAPEHQRIEYPHTYKVGLSKGLHNLRDRLIREKNLKV